MGKVNMGKAGRSPSLLPLWEKVPSRNAKADEGSLSAETDPSPVSNELRSFDPPSPTRGEGKRPPMRRQLYAAYTDDFGSGNTGSCVLMLVGQTTEICSPAFCITTGVERSFWPESGVPGR